MKAIIEAFLCSAILLSDLTPCSGQLSEGVQDLGLPHRAYLEKSPGSLWYSTPQLLNSSPGPSWWSVDYLLQNQHPCHPEVLFYVCDRLLSNSIFESQRAEESLMKFAMKYVKESRFGPSELNYQIDTQHPDQVTYLAESGLFESKTIIPNVYSDRLFICIPAPREAKFVGVDIFSAYNTAPGRRLARLVHYYWSEWISKFSNYSQPAEDSWLRDKLDPPDKIPFLREAINESYGSIRLPVELTALDPENFQKPELVRKILKPLIGNDIESYFRMVLDPNRFSLQKSMLCGAYLLELSGNPEVERAFGDYLCDLVLNVNSDISRRAEGLLRVLKQSKENGVPFKVEASDRVFLSLIDQPWPHLHRSKIRSIHRGWRKWWFETYESEGR